MFIKILCMKYSPICGEEQHCGMDKNNKDGKGFQTIKICNQSSK